MSLKSNYEYIRDWCNHKFLTKDEQISVDLSNYYTKSEVDSAITDATDDIDLSNYVTDSELATGLSTKQNTISDLSTIRSNAAAGAAKVSNVQSDWNATSGLARILNKPDLDDYLTIEDYTQDEEVVAAALNDLNSNKQATLVSGTNIKTVNGTSLLGSGNIDVQDGKSAYQLWLDQGNVGTEAEFIASLKGPQGEKGEKGEPGEQGPQGNTGSSVDYPFELVNNLTTDDPTKALSAAQGKVLDGKISQLHQYIDHLQATMLWSPDTVWLDEQSW